MKTPAISVIVPIYNVEDYLGGCIDSVLGQTFDDFELILVDDGSPDGSGRICDAYALKDSRIRVIHKKNGGLSSARNAGLDAAKGKYVYFLDGDDWIREDLLEKAVSGMEAGSDLVAFRYLFVYPTGTKEQERFFGDSEFKTAAASERLAFISQILLAYKIGWEACTRVFRRSLIEEHGLRFADNRKIFAEDLYFSLCYCAHMTQAKYVDECLYYYRQREDSIMGVQRKNSNIHRINELGKEVLNHYRQCEDCKLLADKFPVIHMQIMAGEVISEVWSSRFEPEEFQRLARETVQDWDFLEQQVRSALRSADLIRYIRPVGRVFELRAHAAFLLGGSWKALRMKSALLRVFQGDQNS